MISNDILKINASPSAEAKIVADDRAPWSTPEIQSLQINVDTQIACPSSGCPVG